MTQTYKRLQKKKKKKTSSGRILKLKWLIFLFLANTIYLNGPTGSVHFFRSFCNLFCNSQKSFPTCFTPVNNLFVNVTHSSWVDVTSGVPQGSVLGPALFLLYINDINDHIKSKIKLFADDSIVYREIWSPEDHNILQQDLDMLAEWSTTLLMHFDVKKCASLSITRKRNPRYFSIPWWERFWIEYKTWLSRNHDCTRPSMEWPLV